MSAAIGDSGEATPGHRAAAVEEALAEQLKKDWYFSLHNPLRQPMPLREDGLISAIFGIELPSGRYSVG
jgi:hypothetical protein